MGQQPKLPLECPHLKSKCLDWVPLTPYPTYLPANIHPWRQQVIAYILWVPDCYRDWLSGSWHRLGQAPICSTFPKLRASNFSNQGGFRSPLCRNNPYMLSVWLLSFEYSVCAKDSSHSLPLSQLAQTSLDYFLAITSIHLSPFYPPILPITLLYATSTL